MFENTEMQTGNIIIHDGVTFNIDRMTKLEITRLNLAIEMNKFLAEGNVVTSLPQGQTNYPDGILPPAGRQNSNLPVTPVKSSPPVKKQDKTTRKPSNTKRNQAAKNKGQKLDPIEIERRKKVTEAHREASLKGLREFQAPCAIHELTTYISYSNGCKCKKCVEDRRKKYKAVLSEDTDRSVRSKIISQRRQEAIQKGLTSFIGVCRIHKDTLYKIQSNGSRCYQCKLEQGEVIRNNRRTEEQYLENERKKKNKPLIQKAIEENANEFEANCKNCGLTTFKFKSVAKNADPNKRYAYCICCAKKQYKKTI